MMSENEPIVALRLTLASPEQMRSWSCGEVSLPETINYLTGKPEPQGLFCERIFGPTTDWTCACGKYRQARTPGFVCEACGVKITTSSVRRERMGHIELAAPVAHPWFARHAPSIIGLLLDLTPRQLNALLSSTCFLVLAIDEAKREHVLREKREGHENGTHDPNPISLLSALTVGDILDESTFRQLSSRYGGVLRAGHGAEAIRERLATLDLDALTTSLRQTIDLHGAAQRKALQRLQAVEAFRTSGVDPCWMILSVIPVLPPELRPLVPMDGGRFASSDLNALYERIISRNNRLKRFLALQAPEAMLNNEKRLLQEACDALFDNGHRNRPLTGSGGHRLRSLTEAISGKQGHLRKHLLGKRVDYSGRSVIVGDPKLSLHQCGLPTRMCLELFKPFLIRKLLQRQYAVSARAAKRLVERTRKPDPILWDLLEEVMHEKLVLLNRAPTLHRLSIQAFEAVRVEGNAITLHPLVCSAFNADFDGDQMAVHLPLSDEAQAEARALLLSTRNLRSPASGDPSISLSQDIVLGLFYLTQDRPSGKSAGRVFTDTSEVLLALDAGVIDLHTRIIVRTPDHIISETPERGTARPAHQRIEMTAGRLLFNEALPETLRFKNDAMTKERLKLLVIECLKTCGPQVTAQMADRLKALGFHYATRSGVSFALSDIEVPPAKHEILSAADVEAEAVEQTYHAGMITAEERYRQLIEVWTRATETISARLEAALDPWGSLATIIQSGATKAKFQQIRQLSGIRGLMANPSGDIIAVPVRGNYLEGLRVWELFIAASGARKGFMDRSLNTARSGYLTRRLVEVGLDAWITEEDCGTTQGLLITDEESKSMGFSSMRDRLLDRALAESLPQAGLEQGTMLSEEKVARLLVSGITAVRVRSPLTCQAPSGICQRCYGIDLATGHLVRRGTAVGIIAAQSIGEPGTQLTMRTFHSGGIAHAQGDITQGLPRVEELFEVRRPKQRAVISEIDGTVEVERDEATGAQRVRVISREELGGSYPPLPDNSADDGVCGERMYVIHAGRSLLVEHGQTVSAGTPLTDGTLDPRDLLRILGREPTARYLVREVQRVYRGTGVYLHDKHLEVIVRQMLRFVWVREVGDTPLLPGEIVDRFTVEATNARVLAEGGAPALATPVLLGLTRAALQTRSPIAAASFQDTARVLTWAAIRGEWDPLQGFKERLVAGRRIPTTTEREKEHEDGSSQSSFEHTAS
jgi:DNA-directed RNA polymerase subunit beta'